MQSHLMPTGVHLAIMRVDEPGVTGRRDATAAGPTDRLPAETMDAATQRAAFAAKSLSTQEMVALLGAHTVRVTRQSSTMSNRALKAAHNRAHSCGLLSAAQLP